MLRTTSLLAVLASCSFSGSDDGKPPTVVSVTPADGAAEVWLHDPITVTFSEAIDPDSVAAATVVVTAEDGTALAATATLGGDKSVMTVRISDDVALIGGVRMTLTSGITDVAGNELADTSVGWMLPAWSRAAAAAGATPSLAIGDDGRVLVAWSTNKVNTRRVMVSELGANGWVALGEELGAGDAALPSITFDAQDRPIVVWSEFAATAAVRAARWDGAAWAPLASPGDGAYAVAARAPASDPMLAFVTPSSFSGQSVVRVLALVGDAWQPLANAPDVAVNGGVSGLPQLALVAPDAPVVAFVDTGTGAGTKQPSVRVLRWVGSWLESSISIGTQGSDGTNNSGELNRVALAAHGDTVDVAYDTYSGFSFGVHVVRVDVQGLVRPLGGELDVDPPADAQAPAVAHDADGTPVVVWRELVEGNWRGFVARWDGATWRAAPGGAWNDDATRAIVRPVMRLAGGRAPIIAWGEQSAMDPTGAIRVARWNGPVVARFGLDTRASINGCAFDGTQATLSATGCFSIASGHATPHAGLIPFDIVSELWSDGARKRRWIALPDGQMLTTAPTGAWSAPAGSMMIKEFAIETTPGDPRTRRVVETRLLVLGASSTMIPGWQGYTFRWRADGSDADLLPDTAITVDWPLDNGTMHTHSYPSRAQCQRCHHASNGPLLGVRTGQLARRYDYDGVMGDQLDTLAHIGAITMPSDVRAFAAPHDPTLPLEQRMRGYVAANCAHCHNPGGERPTRDFRWETPLADTKLCGTDAEVVMGDPASSVIFQRISTRVGGMPPLATLKTDPLAIDVIGRWIAGEVNCQ